MKRGCTTLSKHCGKALICQITVIKFFCFGMLGDSWWVTHEIKLSEPEDICLSFVTWHTVKCATHSFTSGPQLRFIYLWPYVRKTTRGHLLES